MKRTNLNNLLVTIAITIFGIMQEQVTVFYIIYLFWFQEFIRTVIDIIYSKKLQRKTIDDNVHKSDYLGSLFLLFVYVVFIIVLFCFMLNWGNNKLLFLNLQVLFFKNIFFNCNLLFFALSFLFFRVKGENKNIRITAFNSRHVVLHISIILGALVQFFIVKKYNIENTWGSVAVIAPFLLLKFFFEINLESEEKKEGSPIM